jgi:tetratricopeptide (TPR) repeat protein
LPAKERRTLFPLEAEVQTCPDTLAEHYGCAMRASQNSYRFAEAAEHFRRALELAGDRPTFALANVLIYYGWLLVRIGRVDEGITLIERRLALPRFNGEDRLERRCTTEQLAALRAERGTERPTT